MERKKKGFIMADNDIMETLGGTCAVIYGIIRETYLFWQSKGELVDGYCYLTEPTIYKRTMYGKRLQRAAIKKLLEHGLIERKFCGMPRRQCFKILNFSQSAQMNLQVGANEPTSSYKRTDKSAQMNLQVGANVCLSNTRDNTRYNTRAEEGGEEGELYRNIQQYGMLSPLLAERIKKDIDDYGIAWCKEAFEVAKRRGKANWSYAQGVIKRWEGEYGRVEKPWELERNDRKTNSNRQSTKARTDVDWSKESDEIC